VTKEDLSIQIPVVTLIAIIATVGVYGIVALIVRMDDAGYKLIENSKDEKSLKAKLGGVLVAALPKIIKSLTVIGTIALLLVSGGIFAHNIDFFHNLIPVLPSLVTELLIGLVVGFICLLLVNLALKLKKQLTSN
jgi:predicted DNA repair protein MutK